MSTSAFTSRFTLKPTPSLVLTLALSFPLPSSAVSHDCETYCDLTCADSIHQTHISADLPLNCSNVSPVSGPQANWCMFDYNNQPSYTIQICGNGALPDGSSGCAATGKLKCPKPSGGFNYPDYNFTCAHNGGWGGAPAQSVSEHQGVCTWPNGYSAVMACTASGGVGFGMYYGNAPNTSYSALHASAF